ncbi:MAG: hypothetical protein DCC67_09330 [Planctomycetota bacterium]|nr:MAG: hypothetical protein DCC67_09330 [Planctomycetota bacterium]
MTMPGPSKLRQCDQATVVGSGKWATPQAGSRVAGGRHAPASIEQAAGPSLLNPLTVDDTLTG